MVDSVQSVWLAKGRSDMGTKTLLTLEQFDQLPEEEGAHYELDEGELIAMPTARPRHNLVRDNIADPLTGC